MFALFYAFLYINDVKKRIQVLAKPQRSSLRIHLCASERSERAIFGVFNSFTVKKVNFFTINVIFKVILFSKSGGGGGDVCTGHPPTQKSGGMYPPIPPGFTPVALHNEPGCPYSFWFMYKILIEFTYDKRSKNPYFFVTTEPNRTRTSPTCR